MSKVAEVKLVALGLRETVNLPFLKGDVFNNNIVAIEAYQEYEYC